MKERDMQELYKQAHTTLCKIAIFLHQLEEQGEAYHGTTQETSQGKHLQPYEKPCSRLDDTYRVTDK